MKKTLASLLFSLALFTGHAFSQCTPGDATTCPDFENNGEVCPEELPNAVINQLYSQEFTILAPPQYVVDSVNGIIIDLHHIQIKDVSNLPPGITWVSNAPDSNFMVGIYYCVLLEGTPSLKGVFPLKIVVDVYVPGIFGSPPIKVATVTDSTSLSISVTDPSGIADQQYPGFYIRSASPNPFQKGLSLEFLKNEPGICSLKILNLQGQTVYEETIRAKAGTNVFPVFAEDWNPGLYFYELRDGQYRIGGKIVKTP